MRPPRVYAKPSCPAGCPCDVLRLLHGPHRIACRLLMILPQQGLAASHIADLLGYGPATVRRWIHRYQQHGTGGLADRPRSGRPRLGSKRLAQRVLTALGQPKAWTIARLWHATGRPPISLRTLHRRVREVANWRRPRLVAKGDPTVTSCWPILGCAPRHRPSRCARGADRSAFTFESDSEALLIEPRRALANSHECARCWVSGRAVSTRSRRSA